MKGLHMIVPAQPLLPTIFHMVESGCPLDCGRCTVEGFSTSGVQIPPQVCQVPSRSLWRMATCKPSSLSEAAVGITESTDMM